MANPQPTDAHIRIALEIEEQLIIRKFTQRQTSALRLILRLSWGCGKKRANIPKMKDFELCGIAANKAKDELEYLEESRVIFWHRETNEFEFNKDYDQWVISKVKGFDHDRFDKLIHLNLTEKEPPKKGANLPKEEDSSQKGSLPKREESSQKGTEPPKKGASNLPKREGEGAEIPCPARADEVPIVSSYRKTKDHDDVLERLSKFKSVYDAYEHFFGAIPNPIQLEKLHSYLDDGMEALVVYRAFEITRLRNKPINYALRVIDNAFQQGLHTLAQMLVAEEEFQSGGQQAATASGVPQPPYIEPEDEFELELARRLMADA